VALAVALPPVAVALPPPVAVALFLSPLSAEAVLPDLALAVLVLP
jgi:hypothetical protein